MTKFFTILTFLIFYASFLTGQTTHTVCASGCGYATITEAIAGAVANDIISITDAVHTEHGITIDKDLIFQSGYYEGTIIQAHADGNSATDRVFNIPAAATVVTMENLTIRHGRSSLGGAINNSGDLSLINCTISENTAVTSHATKGGGIHNLGTLSMTNCSISDNLAYGYATNTYSYGGGLFNDGTLTMNNCTFSGNTAHCFSSHGSSLSKSHGAGIYNNTSGIATMTNCTLFENICKSYASYIYNASGGGIYNNNGTITLMNCTIAANASDPYPFNTNSSSTCTGGGIFNNGAGSLTVTNTIIADNTGLTNVNLHGTPTASTFSICEGCTTGSWTSTADPMLVDLADNCGITQTCAITNPASPAIDAGTSTGATTFDQRGRPRVNAVDIGAFELNNNSPIIFTVGSSNCDFTSVAAAIATVCPGDIVSILDEVHTEQGIVINKDVTIKSGHAQGTIIQAHANENSATDRVFNIPATATVVTMENLTIRHGRSSLGGAINNSGDLSLINCTISENSAITSHSTKGGGIYNMGTLSMTDCSISDNLAYGYATNTYSYGGGLFNDGTLTMNNCTFSGNTAHCFSSHGSSLSKSHGAGIYNNTGGVTTMTNCTVSENICKSYASASYDASGGGIYNYAGTITLMNCTIAGNVADPYPFNTNWTTCTGGGIFNFNGGSLTMTNTIIANNTATTNPNSHGNPTTNTNNICEGCTGSWTSTDDPMIGTLGVNCGITENCAIIDPSSPAIDAGTSTGAPSLDQVGQARVNAVDIGAYEFHEIAPEVTAVERPAAGYALNLDGTDQYVDLPDGIVSAANDFTFETWFYINTNASWARLMDFGSSTTVNMFLTPSLSGNNTPRFAITTSGNGNEQQLTAPSALPANKWYHIAITIDDASNTGTMYINGVMVTQNTSMTLNPSSLDNTTNNYLGKSQYPDPYLNGKMDEVRIWNKALSQSEIRDWMCKKVENTHPQWCSLVSYYRFDENTGTTVADNWGANDGTLVNTPNWETSGVPLGDESTFEYYSVSTGTSINLSHPNGDQMTVTVTAGTADAIQLYRVDEAPNLSTPPTGIYNISQTNHWGVKVFGGVGCEYQVVYNYDGHPDITQESHLELLRRDDNADMDWETTTAIIDEASNTLTLGGQTGTQFALASNSPSTLPVELIHFNAQLEQDIVKLDWRTSSEIDNDYFEIERSPFGNNWTSIDRVNGQGNSSVENSYTSYDRNPMEGKSYYRLKQVDLDGKFSYSGIRSVTFNSIDENAISVFPNPAKGQVNIMAKSSKASAMNVKLLNLHGATVMAMDQSLSEGTNQFTLHLGDLTPGLYYITIQKGNTITNKKLLIK